MASKYAALRGKVPTQPKEKTDKDKALDEQIAARQGKTLDELTAEYNAVLKEADDVEKVVNVLALKAKAIEALIQAGLDSQNLDAVKANGFTWSVSSEPYPVVLAADVDSIVQYFKEHDMEDQLALKASEIAARLKTFVKEEAVNNELVVEIKTVVIDGKEVEVHDVRSKIPNVRVFLKESISRVKSSTKS